MKYLKVWTDFTKVLAPLTDAETGRLFLHMLHYASTGEEPHEFAGNERFLWQVAKRDIDTMAEKSEALRQNGLKGGRPKNKENQEEPNETKENQNEPEESLKEKKRKEIKRKENKKEIFTPPTVEDVSAYCAEQGIKIDAGMFVDYYTSNGWKAGKNPMKDWKATVRNWARRDKTQQTKVVVAQQYEQRNYSGVQEQIKADQDREIMEFLKKGAG